MSSQKGLMMANKPKHRILKGMTEEKEETTNKRKTEKDFEQWLWGEIKKKQNISLKYRTQLLCITDSKTRLKNQICKESGVVCHNLKPKHQTQDEEKKQPAREGEKYKTNQDINNRNTRQAQNESNEGLRGGCQRKMLKGKKPRMKNGKKNKKSKRKTTPECSLKGLMKKRCFEMKEACPPPKKDQEQVKDFEASGLRGKQQPQN